MFHTVDPQDILDGRITDVYFERTLKILKAKGINPVVKAEFIAKSFPSPKASPCTLMSGSGNAGIGNDLICVGVGVLSIIVSL